MPSLKPNSQLVRLFYSYSHEDEALRDELETHLSLLKRQGVIHSWHDRKIAAGREWEGAIDENLEASNVILLLISANFLASDYCYDREMKRALEKHEAGEARVIPVIIRPVDWGGAPFSKLQALPKDAKPVTSWPNRDEGWTDVARGIRKAIGELTVQPTEPPRRRSVMSLHKFDLQRIQNLEELLNIEYDKLHEFEKEITITSSAAEKFELRQRLKREVLPNLHKHEKEYAELLADRTDPDSVPQNEAETTLTEVNHAVASFEKAKGDLRPDELQRLLTEIKEKLDEPGKTAAAKLKVTFPLIPLIASYEMEVDTELLLTRAWHRVKDLFSRGISSRP